MIIKNIKMENWKSYAERTIIRFEDGMNLIDQRNGTGKTSIFEAIIFCLYGQMPTGFNFTTLRNDPMKLCRLELNFEDKGSTYCIKRSFGGGKTSTSELYCDGELLSNTARALVSYINKIVPSNIFQTLWSSGSIQSSAILRTSFIKDNMFEHVFSDPLKIRGEINIKLRELSKFVKENEIDEKHDYNKDLQEIRNKINEIEIDLQGKSEKTDNKYKLSQAILAKESAEEIKQIKDVLNKDTLLEQKNIISKINSLGGIAKIKDTLNEETSKGTKSRITGLSNDMLHKSCMYGRENHKCILCNGTWTKDIETEIVALFKSGERDETKIAKLQDILEQSKNLKNEILIKQSERYHELKRNISLFSDYDEYIKNYEEGISEKWDKLKNLQREEKLIEAKIKIKEDCFKKKDEILKLQKQKSIIDEYIKDATDYYSSTIKNIASSYINKINSRYGQLFIENGEYYISVMSDDMQSINILNVNQLSGGERTIVAFCIILAAHDQLYPDMPLLFDESFSALDRENINELQHFIPLHINFQTFVITHDKSWRKDEEVA